MTEGHQIFNRQVKKQQTCTLEEGIHTTDLITHTHTHTHR